MIGYTVETINGIAAAKRWFDDMPEQSSNYQSFSQLMISERHGTGIGGLMRSLRVFISRVRGLSQNHDLGWDNKFLTDFRDLKTYAVIKDGKPVLLAPLWTCNLNDRCVYGSAETFNSSDFVYANVSIEELNRAFDVLMARLVDEGCKLIHWCFLHETSISVKFLHQYSIKINGRYVNTSINLDYSDYTAYVKTLGKHAAQNLRTAYNRITRDGHKIAFDFQFHPKSVPNEVVKLYAVRQTGHYREQSHLSWRDWLRWCVFKDGFAIMTSRIGFLAQLKIDDKVAAFMGGMANARFKMLEVPKLAIDIAYKFYSPGLLLMSEMARFLIEKTNITVLNMGRGDEKYKLDMGGGGGLLCHLNWKLI